MRCTNCYKKVKPVVAIDIDGTLGNYHGHFWDHMRGYLGIPVPDPTPMYCGSLGFKKWAMDAYNITESEWNDIKLTYRQGASKRTMPVYPYAAELCDGVRRIAELWLTTTRPFQRLDNIDPDTREWLDRHGIKYDGLLYDEQKYTKLYQSVGSGRVVAVLDDLLEELHNAESNFGYNVPILRRTQFNCVVEYPRMVNDLGQAFDMIFKKVESWNERHASAA